MVGNHLCRIYLGLYISNTDVERRGRHGRLLAVIDKRGSVLYVALKGQYNSRAYVVSEGLKKRKLHL